MNVEDVIRTEYVDVQVSYKLKKDLQKNEEICKDCNGVGIRIMDARYGLTVDGKKLGNGMFPFNKQSIIWCAHCYNGVRKRCEYCSELVSKMYVDCQCEKALESRGKASWQIDKERWDKAEKISYKTALDKFDMVFIDSLDKYVITDELPEELQHYIDDNEEIEIDDIKNLKIYGTTKTSATLDATNILVNATEDLHEEAYDRSKYILKKLQGYLDEINEEIAQDTSTYNASYKCGIQITNEDIISFKLEF